MVCVRTCWAATGVCVVLTSLVYTVSCLYVVSPASLGPVYTAELVATMGPDSAVIVQQDLLVK